MSGKTIIPWLLAVGALPLCPAVTSAQPIETLPRDQLATVCWPELAKVRTLTELDPIPVGCELVDCCPGCPKPESLEWRIRLEGGPVQSATLKFDNLSPEQVARLKFDGDVTPLDESGFRIGKSKARILGLPGDARDLPPVGRISLVYDPKWGAGRIAESSKEELSLDADDRDDISLVIEQRLGNVVVNEYLLKYELRFCGPHESDRIDLVENTGNDMAVVLFNGGRDDGACLVDEFVRGTGPIPMGNLVSSSTCPSNVAVFSDDDAMKLLENVGAWTSRPVDALQVPLKPDRLMAPVRVWLVRRDAKTFASESVDVANFFYNANNAGIGFDASGRQDVSRNPAATQATANGCTDLAGLTASEFFVPGRLNVYFVDQATTGFACAKNRNVMFVGTLANHSTLAHEFGHAMSLPDVESTNIGFTNQNVMFEQGGVRKVLSEGQLFRASVHCGSMLNLNGVRAPGEPKRNCPNAFDGELCPSGLKRRCPVITLEVLPN